MSEFTAITTQDELNAVIGDRLKRNDEKWQKKFEGYMSPEEVSAKTSDLEKQLLDATNALDVSNKKYSIMEKDIADRDSKIKSYEVSAMKYRIVNENNWPNDAIDFLQGDDEDSINASAEKFKGFYSKMHSAPAFSNEPDVSNSQNQSIKKLAQSLTKS